MTVSEHIDALRKLMKERGYDIYIVPTDDFHQSENVGAYFQARTFITGFDGSAGTAIITLDHAGLWTDGRYFLQAEQQLSGTPVTLYRMLEPGVPSINEFLEKHLPEHGTIGFDREKAWSYCYFRRSDRPDLERPPGTVNKTGICLGIKIHRCFYNGKTCPRP